MCNLQQTYEDLSRLSVLLHVLVGATCVLLCVLDKHNEIPFLHSKIICRFSSSL